MEQTFKGNVASLKTTYVIMRTFDINLSVARTVVATINDGVIKKGEKYFVDSFQVSSSKTYLHINGKDYNSVNFAEFEESPLMKAISKVKAGNKLRSIAQLTKAIDLKLRLAKRWDMSIDDDTLSSMPLEGVIVIGRDESCDVKTINFSLKGKEISLPFSTEVSRVHAIIYRETETSWEIFDVSTFGTKIVI